MVVSVESMLKDLFQVKIAVLVTVYRVSAKQIGSVI